MIKKVIALSFLTTITSLLLVIPVQAVSVRNTSPFLFDCYDLVTLPPIYGHGTSTAILKCAILTYIVGEYQVTIHQMDKLVLEGNNQSESDPKKYFAPNATDFISNNQDTSSWAIKEENDTEWHSEIGDVVYSEIGPTKPAGTYINFTIGVKAGKNAQMENGTYYGNIVITASTIDGCEINGLEGCETISTNFRKQGTHDGSVIVY